jgi:uncharacterized membrane protein
MKSFNIFLVVLFFVSIIAGVVMTQPLDNLMGESYKTLSVSEYQQIMDTLSFWSNVSTITMFISAIVLVFTCATFRKSALILGGAFGSLCAISWLAKKL